MGREIPSSWEQWLEGLVPGAGELEQGLNRTEELWKGEGKGVGLEWSFWDW